MLSVTRRREVLLLLAALVATQHVLSLELGGDITGTLNLTQENSPYRVTSNLVVTTNSVLNVEPGTEIQFAAGIGLQVYGTLNAQGTSSDRITFQKIQVNGTVDVDNINGSVPYNKNIRLVDGANYKMGRLELYINNRWGTVCNDAWDMQDTQVACGQLGFLGAKRFYTHRGGTGSIWLDDVNCKGSEKSLLKCRHRGIGSHNCRHTDDIGIECHTLLVLLADKLYWTGIEYKDTASTNQLRNVDINNAFTGIKGNKVLPSIHSLSIKDSAKGIKSEGLTLPLTITDSIINGSLIRGVEIVSGHVALKMNNSHVTNTTSGHGFEYSRMKVTPLDLLEVEPTSVVYPLWLSVVAKPGKNVDQIKVFKTTPGHKLTLHFQSLSGTGHSMEARDGDNVNATLLSSASQTDSGQAVKSAVTTGHVLWIRYRFSGSSASAIKMVLTDSADPTSLRITNSKFTVNRGHGFVLKDVTNRVSIANTEFTHNSQNGMNAENIAGSVSASNVLFAKNNANGAAFHHSSISDCGFEDITAFDNQQKGMLFYITSVICNITRTSLSRNRGDGFVANRVAGLVNLSLFNASENAVSGVDIYDGSVSVNFYSSYILRNKNYGFSLRNNAGVHKFVDSYIQENQKHGIYMYDVQNPVTGIPRRQFTGLDIVRCDVSDNLQYGILLWPACQNIGGSTANVSIIVTGSSINRNSHGAIRLTPNTCLWGSRFKRVSFSVLNNELRENKKHALYTTCSGFYRLKADIRGNRFQNNSGQVIVMIDEDFCAASVSNPVQVNITQNSFLDNLVINAVYLDFKGFPLIRKAHVRENIFEGNQGRTMFPKFFRRSTDKALVVFKEGTFEFQENLFERNGYRYLLSTLYFNHRSIIDARYNWWNTSEECEIKDRICDFHDRVQLAEVKYFPFLLSLDRNDIVSTSISRKSCFLRGQTIGGALDRELVLPSSLLPYKVRDDILILSNGFLRIPSNTTLEFPPRAAMLVQGQLHVMGKREETVQFKPGKSTGNVRLTGGAGPWKGRVEVMFNDTWFPVCVGYSAFSTEGKIACKQLGYLEYYRYSRINPKADEHAFVTNLRCSEPNQEDITECNKQIWTLAKSCSYVAHIQCSSNHWSGVHLAVSNKKSELHYLEILNAGFAYRNDIGLPGFSLRVDYDHHNFSNINVNSSVGIGVQVVHSNPFLKKSLMPSSRIAHTASIGVWLGSPYLKLTDVEVTSTKGVGLYYQSMWDVSTKHAAHTLSPNVKTIESLCLTNKTYLKRDDILYLTLPSLPKGPTMSCEHLLVTDPGFKVGIQVLFSSFQYGNYLHAFDGNTSDSALVGKIETINTLNRGAFSSSHREMLLRLFKPHGYSSSFSLLVSSIEDDLIPLDSFIEIENVKFDSNVNGPISIYGNVIQHLSITNCSVTKSSNNLVIQPRSLTVGVMKSVSLENNQKGIVLGDFTGTFSIYNSTINGTATTGLTVNSNGVKTLRFISSSITHSGERAFIINGYYMKMMVSVQNSTFRFNRKGVVYSSQNYYGSRRTSVVFESNWFVQNLGPTIEIAKGADGTTWVLTDNTFERNSGFAVIASGTRSHSYASIQIQRNIFEANQCKDKAVIDIRNQNRGLEVLDNSFVLNDGSVILIEGTATTGPLVIAGNTFERNNCTTRELFSALRINDPTEICNNTFRRNKAKGIILLQSVYSIPTSQDKLFVMNNTFEDNMPATPSLYLMHSCVLRLRGLLQHKVPRFHFNRFVDPDFEKEFCLNVPAHTQMNSLNLSRNWWGTSENYHVIRQRVVDFDSNHDYAIAQTSPFLASQSDFKTVNSANEVSGLNGNKLGGRLFGSVVLTEEDSPYDVTSDLTVLPNVVLTMEPNVELRFSPGTSLLVLGTLIARGKPGRKIKFTAAKPKAISNVRLHDGTFPWQGRLEMFHRNTWMPVCWPEENWNQANTKVICEELGYSWSNDMQNSKFEFGPQEAWPFKLSCHGNESSIRECHVVDQPVTCNTSEYIGLECKGKPWGNLLFVSSRKDNTTQERSILENIDITHCGQHANTNVSAIESIINTPTIRFSHIHNCTFGGLRYFLSNSDVHIYKNEFRNLWDAGFNFLQTNQNVTLEENIFHHNYHGVVFDEPQQQNIPAVHYGRLMICDTIRNVYLSSKMVVYFGLDDLETVTAGVTCQKDFYVPYGKGVRIRVLYYQGTQTITIFDKAGTFLIRRGTNDIKAILLKELVVAERANIQWYGEINSKVMFEVDVVDLKTSEIPCNFEFGTCGWQSFSNMTINDVDMTTTWKVTADWYTYRRQSQPDNSFFSRSGKVLAIGNSGWPTGMGRASIVSPLLRSSAQVCSLVFYYRLGRAGKSSLELFLQKGSNIFDTTVELVSFWKPKSSEVLGWTKVVLDLPKDLMEYRLLFVGSYNVSNNYNYRNFITLDDIEFQKCVEENHQVLHNIISDSKVHGIFYRSTSSSRNSLAVKMNTIIRNGDSFSENAKKGAVSIELKDNAFHLSNNYIAHNRIGGICAKLETSDGYPTNERKSRESWIYGNTFLMNGKETVCLQSTKGVAIDTVQIRDNSFSSNYGKDYGNTKLTIVNIKDVISKITGNFFYNNSGLYILEYFFSNKERKGLQCVQNTFFLNVGTASDYGATIRTNGPIEYHQNNLKNPYNLYELDTTLSAVSDPVNADKNWFGFGLKPTVKSRIREHDVDFRLPKVVFEPFVKIQPRNILSFGCPAEWMNAGSTCYVFRAGAQSFREANVYCKYYGGHVLSSHSPGDRELLAILKTSVTPNGEPPIPMWITTEDEHQQDGECNVFTHEEKTHNVSCNRHYSYACSRNAVIRCPNGCFHNGDCIGSTCFCYSGWTGEDCSKFHCRDVHDCSGFGACVGPNVCKCMTGFLGRGCTYSYCGKFKRCSRCATDPNCGWCDTLRQCMPGNYSRPHQAACRNWFYYNCYTVGSVNRCSNNIQRVDCVSKQCNVTRGDSNKESCRKCSDLEKCYNLEEEGKCRSWNVTRCPHGLVQVDYTDQSRINSTQLLSNVKVIDPENITIYDCPVMLPGKDEVTSVFVVPRDLGLRVGHVLTSKQAGGIMHIVNQTNDIGPYTIVVGERAKIEDVVEYADFESSIDPERITDEVTEEDPPNREEINGLFNGKIKLHNTTMHLLPPDKYVYKCVGHLYPINDEHIVSHYLVMDAANSVNAKVGDLIVAKESFGFIEKVTHTNRTHAAMFIHTTLERCDGNSTWNTKFKPRRPGSPEDEDVICTGGDNNPGLLISGSEDDISVDDIIIGRRSQPFIAKVVSSSTNGDYVIMEVLPVKSVVNGSAVTQVRIDELHPHHRRTKRDVERKQFTLSTGYETSVTFNLGRSGYISIQEKFSVSAKFVVRMGVFRKKDANGDLKVSDAMIGLEMTGKVKANTELQLGLEKRDGFSLYHRSYLVVRPRQIGPDICIPVMGFCIPSAFFLEVRFNTDIKANMKVFVPITYSSTATINLGASCSYMSGCRKQTTKTNYVKSVKKRGRVKAEWDLTWENLFVPKLTYKVPTVPRLLQSLVNRLLRLWYRLLSNIPGGSEPTFTDVSLLRLSVEVPFGIKVAIKPCSDKCSNKKPQPQHELALGFGLSEMVGKLAVGFGTRNREIGVLKHKLPGGYRPSSCFRTECYKDECMCATTPPPTTEGLSSTPATMSGTGTGTGSTTPGSTTSASTTSASSTANTPTPPPCKCDDGQTGVEASDGQCDCPPECKDGRKPVYVNDKYECPDHPPCGVAPSCVTGRKGEDCSQPDVSPCDSGCSGNGAVETTDECSSRCRCSRRWTGQCCDVQRPASEWGDPHLETLDGIQFDYFGIGEFWGCRSVHNAFGMQFRYFAYKRASLTGGVALRAGRSVISIMTIETDNPLDMPLLRINGALVNLTGKTGRQIELENRTVLLDVQKNLNYEDDGRAVVLLSLQYESGVTVAMYVRHSGMIGRQFLNVLFTVTAAFKGHTQGLCGIMDNNPANDLTGPAGDSYSNPVKFADSWRISSAHNGSGLYDSWSWTSSNFHADDVIDSAYTDPSYVPVYGLDGISDDILKKSRAACEAKGLSGNLLKNCIYDVSVTNDTSFVEQETLKTGCSNQCSGKGRCVNQTCHCMDGWSGASCELGSCPNCSQHGNCVKGFCQCDIGWEGVICDEKATCFNVNNCTSPVHGVCRRTDECACNEGFIGNDCSVVPTCLNVSSCSGRGKCVDYDVCKCDKEWTGNDCSHNSCADLDGCSGHGRCVNVHKCDCDAGWTGISCAVPDCPDVSQCSGHGVCVSSNKCNCFPGYQGNDCSGIADCIMLANCSNHGACVKEEGKNASCRCYHGFNGIDCSQASCNEVNNCSSQGVCGEAGFCKCDVGFTGLDCTNVSCEVLNYCSGHGECIAYDVCKCQPLWHGAACSVPDCSAVNHCTKQGDCLAPNKCECYPGYDGIRCDKKATPNVHPPVFQSAVYNASVYENTPLGTLVVQVNATDLDTGRNGEVMYFLANDVGGVFTVEGSSGRIVVSSALDYEGLKSDLIVLEVNAFDNGKPIKLASTKVYITVIDVNDNCPVFGSSLQASHNISVYTSIGSAILYITAGDKDSGLNGEVQYQIEAGAGVFTIDSRTGVISVIGHVQSIVYHVVVRARDQGMPYCSSGLKLTLRGVGKFTSPPSTAIFTTSRPIKPTTQRDIVQKKASLFGNPVFIAGLAIGACALLGLVLFFFIRIRLKNSKKVTSPNKSSPLLRASRLEMLTGTKHRISPAYRDSRAWADDADDDLGPSDVIELHQVNERKIDF